MRLSVIISFLLFTGVLLGQGKKDSVFIKTPEMIYSFGQKYNTWSVNGGFGSVFMYTDLREYTLIPNRDIHFGPTISLTKHLVPAFGFELQYLQSDIAGRENQYGFEGDLIDISVNGIAIINQMLPHPGPIDDHWNFYLKVGVGATLFRSRLLFSETGNVVQRGDLYGSSNLQYVVLGYEKDNPQKKVTRQKEIVVPLGVGVMYRLNNRFDMGLESILRFSSADNIDNILTGATNDRYLFTALNVSYKLGSKERRHMRWTYRSEGMDFLGRKQKNSIEDEIKRLAEDIAKYEANRPVKKDSVIISETLRVIYDRYNVKTLFFNKKQLNSFSLADQYLLGQIAVEMHHSPQKEVYLYGYSHSEKDAESNKLRSQKQCEDIKKFMVDELGILPTKINIVAQGADDPLNLSEQASEKVRNLVKQRVDIMVK